jgi:polar amino acid transport system permease protein
MAFDGTLAQLRRQPGMRSPDSAAAIILPISVAILAVVFVVAYPQTSATLMEWVPLLARGFAMNVAIALVAILAATAMGILIGMAESSPLAPVRWPARAYVQIFRNAPYLVVIFATTYIFPFELRILGHIIAFPDWIKAAVGLALPASAYTAELVRGAIQSIPRTQWEAAVALGFSRWQTLRWIILPQCVQRILPPWTNLLATVSMSTALAALVGVPELLHSANDASTAVQRNEFTVAVYLLVLLWFFLFSYPLSRFTQRLERRFAIH